MSEPELLPGAEPYSVTGNPNGVLVVHGFTGSPQSMRGLAESFAAAGFDVELPLLPGHGTTPADLAARTWTDWTAAAEAAYDTIAGRCDRVVVAGLSMGGAITAWLGTRHPEIAGLVFVNPAIATLSAQERAPMDESLAAGIEFWPAIGGDIADPEQKELAYDEVPVRALRSLAHALDGLPGELAKITSPVLVLHSPQDHVVTNNSSDLLAASVSGPVERVELERSFHVATLDYDRDLINERAVAFARSVLAAPVSAGGAA